MGTNDDAKFGKMSPLIRQKLKTRFIGYSILHISICALLFIDALGIRDRYDLILTATVVLWPPIFCFGALKYIKELEDKDG